MNAKMILMALFFSLSSVSYLQAEPSNVVHRVVDGDTLALRNDERVKLIGIDAPEAINNMKLHRDAKAWGMKSSSVKAMGLRAKAFTATLVEGKKVRLEYEGPKRDRNGRIRAYAYLEDGTFVNAEILRQGFATVTDQPSGQYAELFIAMQKEAMVHERGLWKFIEDREIQLITEEYKSLRQDQREEVLQFIRRIKSGADEPSRPQPQVNDYFLPTAAS